MQFRFDPSKFRLGMRTFKTGLSVFLVLALFSLFGWSGLQIGALTAVFSLREDFDRSVSFGASRIFGNSVGGVCALVYYLLRELLGGGTWVMLVFVPVLTMLTIMVNVACNNKSGIIGGVAALLIITLSIPQGDTIMYVFSRILETFAGVFVAIMVNADVDKVRQWIRRNK